MSEVKASPFVPTKVVPKSKATKKDHEKKPIVALRRLIQNSRPDAKERRSQYAQREDVQKRRQELNQKRRALVRSLMYMLTNGMIFTSDGEVLDNVNGFLCSPSHKCVLKVTKKGQFYTMDYDKEMDLLTDPKYKNDPPDESDQELKTLVKRFVEGDPELERILKKRKVVKEEEESIDFAGVKDIIREKYLQESDSDDISE